MKCQNCNQEVAPGSAFCENCGASLADVQEAMPSKNSLHHAKTIVNLPAFFRLVVVSGLEKDKVVILDKDEVTIGRETDNVLVLLDPLISRHHATLRRKGDAYEIEDLGSANGVYCNGTRISGPQILYDGDKIKLGNTEILFTRLAPAADGFQTAETTIPMHDETPVKPQPAPQVAQPVAPLPPPPPPVSSVNVQPQAQTVNEITAPRLSAAVPAERKKDGTLNWMLLSCAIIVVLALILVALVLVALPRFAPVR